MLLFTTVVDADDTPDEIVVTSARSPTALDSNVGNIAALSREEIEASAHAHIHDLLAGVAGVWITRASGQESLPSIRSPVLTGAGSCGAFLTLEDGVPSRPAGFCNVNQLFELPSELSEQLEVIRGPGNAVYGSNALHGTINVLLPDPLAPMRTRAGVELGANEFMRLSGATRLDGPSPIVLGGVIADDGGFRDDSGYRQFKGYIKKAWPINAGDLTASFSFSDLAQETAGYILGEDAYRDPELNRQNLNPEAFRDASSQRLSLHWSHAGAKFDTDIRAYLRRTDMEFLQHFLPGQPIEDNGHTSMGILADAVTDTSFGVLRFGLDVEVADVRLRQSQDQPTEGSDFLQETRPVGKHYDYDVLGTSIAAWVQPEIRVSERLSLTAGLRAEYAHYDYENNMLVGNTRDDGTPCGFGGCLYTRPSSRTDSFSELAPKIGALFTVSDATSLYLNVAQGFRVPQMTELYRLQNGQPTSDLRSETIDSLELGLRSGGHGWQMDGAIFAMDKKNSVFRDAEGFNVNGGRSRHEGVELSWEHRLGDSWLIAANGSWARHIYNFDVVAARGETFVSGRDIDTAPRWQGSAELRYSGAGRLDASLQWVSLGSYYVDAENRFTYPGHDILNFRTSLSLSEHWSVAARLNNVTNRAYADRADYAFGNHRYFPGRGRELFVRLRYDGPSL